MPTGLYFPEICPSLHWTIGIRLLLQYSIIHYNVEPLTMQTSKCVFSDNISGNVECYSLMLLLSSNNDCNVALLA